MSTQPIHQSIVKRHESHQHPSAQNADCHLVVAQQFFRGIPQRSINCQSQIALQRQPDGRKFRRTTRGCEDSETPP